MNDRASAAPPTHFIGPEAFADADDDHRRAAGAQRGPRARASARALRTKPSLGLRVAPGGGGGVKQVPLSTVRPVVAEEATRGKQEKTEVKQSQEQKKEKRSSKLGQVWSDLRSTFRIKKDPVAPSTALPTTKAPSMDTDRPSKDEVYASYQHLVASGFFSSHAIQSTRQPAPPGVIQRPSTSQANGPAPQWPLPQLPLTPNKSRPSSPVKSPASASSRGTKRAKDDGSDEDEDPQAKKPRKTVSTPRDLAVPKKRSSSRLRSVSNRNFSGRHVSAGAQKMDGEAREPKKLTKRALDRLPAAAVPDRGSSAAGRAVGRRNVSDMIPPARAIHVDGSERVLRPRRSAADVKTSGMGGGRSSTDDGGGGSGLRVKPDANRGIPVVPGIPAKFTYGEDRENNGPWRGLRVARGGGIN